MEWMREQLKYNYMKIHIFECLPLEKKMVGLGWMM